MKEILALICALALAKADPVRSNIASYDETDPQQALIICATPNSDGILIAHENCNQFYQCWDGKPIARDCFGTLQYNPTTEVCDWPDKVDCGDRADQSPGEQDNNDDSGESDNGENNGSGAGNCDPSQAVNICASEGSDGTLVAHEHCNEYFICVNSLPEVQRCPGTLLFDPFKDYCDWPSNVDCGNRVICEEDQVDVDTGNGNNDNSGSVGTGAGNCDPSQAGNICASDGSEGTLVAHEHCNEYYICVNSLPVVQRCPGNLLFDPFKDYCDWPSNVECGDRVICEEDQVDADTGNGNNDNSGSVGTGAGNCDPSQAGNICASDGSEGTLVAHEHCNEYYICVNNLPVVQRCPGNLLFDPFKDYCDWPSNVECGDRVICEEDQVDADTGNGNNDNSGSVGTGAGNCDPSQAGNICASEGSAGTFVSHENCNKYYICDHGAPIEQRCPGTLLFDPFKDYCDWPENVDCGDRKISEKNSKEMEIEDNSSDDVGTENGGSGTCNCNPGEAPKICATDGSDNNLIAHENCNQYYTCAAGHPVAMTCPGGTFYNPYTQVCDWPDNVECSDRKIPEAESEEDNNEIDNGGGTDIDSSESSGSDNGGIDNGSSENGGSGTCNCNPGEAPAICAEDRSDSTLIAHENCNQYYTCAAGHPVAMTCPGGTFYNPYTQVCDWPDNVECSDRKIPEAESEEHNNGIDNGGTDMGSSENGGSDNTGTDDGSSEDGGSGTCNCNPGEAPAICAVDGSDGVLVAHENCNQFYTCVGGKTVTLTCPHGLYYNPHSLVCDWPENVECGDRTIPEAVSEEDNNGNDNGGTDNSSSENGGSDNGGTDNGSSEDGGSGTCNCNPGEAPAICAVDGSDGVLVAHENCNQFYTCVGGKTVTLTCPHGLYYNPHSLVCDWPENVECGDRTIPEAVSEEDNNGTENGSSESGGSDNGGTDNISSEDGGSGTCNCNPGEAPAICAVDGSDGVLVAHENCNQFYTCVGGKTVTLTCPHGLYYNPHSLVCDWPENVECGDRTIPEAVSEEDNNGNDNGGTDNSSSENGGSDNGGTDNGSSEDGGSGTCNCNPGEAPAICAVDGSDGVLVAHENCNQFYTCVGGKTVTLTCPHGLYYNPHSLVCDWPENVECGDRTIPEAVSEEDNNGTENGSSESGGSDNGGTDNISSEDGGSGTCNCNPGEAPAICAVDGSDGVLVAHENCNQFYTCVGGKTVTLTCPHGLYYNPHSLVCDWPENVECGDRTIPEAVSEEDNNGTDNGSSESGGSDNGGTDNGSSEDGGSGICNCNPAEAPTICAGDGSDGVLVAHENCNQFYTCVGGKTVTQTCPHGLYYNPHSLVCDWPENVECGDRTIPEAVSEEDNNGNDNGGTDNGSSENGGSDNGGTDNGSSEDGGSGTCNCNPAEAPTICAGDGSDGVLVAHENCNQFYTCVGGKTVTLTCPHGLYYNPHSLVCDWPENVECGDRTIPEAVSEEDNNGNDNGGTDNSSSENGGSDNGGTDNGSSEDGGSGTCNCNPGEAPAICAVDGSDGVLVAHENCNQFYTCVGGKTVTLTCPHGLYYNPHSLVCDWPENVECGDRTIPEAVSEEDNNGTENGSSESGGSDNGGTDNGSSEDGGSGTCNCNPGEAPAICAVDGSDGVLVAHENCNQFYTCVGGKTVTLTCPHGLYYNPHSLVCDWPENVECGDRTIPEAVSEEDNNGTDNGSSESGGSDNGGTDNGSSEDGGSGICNCNPAEAPTICAGDGSDGVLVAHENCNQFYTCVGGKTVTQTCPHGLYYNPHSLVCDWPENVECGDRTIPEAVSEEDNNGNDNGGTDNGSSENGGSDNGGTDNGSSEDGGSGTCNCNPAEAPTICAVDGSDGVLVAHENCNQFYTCFGGKTVTLTCPHGLLYNPYSLVCDWPENVECGDRTIPEAVSEEDNNGTENGSSESGGSDNGGTDNGSSEDGGSGTCNCNPGEAPAICAVDGSDGVLVAHENCNQFYTCVGGKTVTLTCPHGLYYNPHSLVCDWPENVECGDRTIPEAVSEEDNNGTDNGSSESGGSDNGGTDNGSSEDGGSGICNCNPAEAPTICAGDGSDGVLVAHENCNQFYTCVGGKTVTQTCPHGLYYNPHSLVCDWPENVECGDRTIPEAVSEEDNNGNDNGGTDNGSSENGGSDNGGTDNGSSEDGGSGTCNCNPAEAPTICAVDGSDGVLVAHENCNQFYTCFGGKTVTLTCPHGLLYNPYSLVCDWPENVECGDRTIPEAVSEEDNGSGNDNGGTDNGSSENGGSDNGGTDNGSSEDGGSGTCHCNPGEAPAICAVDGSDGVLVAHKNCNQFYTCLGGNTVTLTCPNKLLYNPYIEICDWPENVECGNRTIPEAVSDEDNNGTESSESGSSENGSSENGGSGTCNCNPGEAPAICAVDGSDGVLVAHENCNQFYTCLGGDTVTLTCPNNLLYNPYTQQCDWPDNVECGERVIPEDCDEENGEDSENSASENEDSEETDEDFSNGNDNSVSESNKSESNESDNETENGNQDTSYCSPDEAASICAAEGSEGTFIAHQNCNQFYACVTGEAVTLTCPGITLYNPYTWRCDWPDNIKCGDRITSEDNNDSVNDSIIDKDSEQEDSDENKNVDADALALATCETLNSEGIFLPHMKCNKFYVCIGNKPVVMSCTGTLLYNHVANQCDWPENVDCGFRIIPSEVNEDIAQEADDIRVVDTYGEKDESEIEQEEEIEVGFDSAVLRCAATGTAGLMVPHEECHRFYMCVSNRPVVFTCTSNNLFDIAREQCNHPENVSCDGRIIINV